MSHATLPVSVHRRDFPEDFVFGAAAAAYQIEGAANKGGKGPSIWDVYTQRYPGKIKDGTNGNVANDSYNRVKEDVQIMKKMGLNAYRFSISWPRLLPTGRLCQGVNREGIDYYNNLIDELLKNGIEPYVTLFHWDLPQPLQDEYQGFLNHYIDKQGNIVYGEKIVADFHDYVDLCFWEFGDRVKFWITFNETWNYSVGGYINKTRPPARTENPGTEPYIVTHNQLLCHANVVHLYRETYKPCQKGEIGITLVSHWFEPKNPELDKEAAKRALDFMLGWILHPLTYGDYPHSMEILVGDRLPKFTDKEKLLLQGSYDFVGLNYYTARYAARPTEKPDPNKPSYETDSHVVQSTDRDGVPIGEHAGKSWIYVVPIGLYKVLNHIKKKYNNPVIYITENGYSNDDNPALTLPECLNDEKRIDYIQRHLAYLKDAIIECGVNVKGYFVWSLMDNYEWNDGYTTRFGMIYIDYKKELARHPKQSAKWYKKFLQGESSSTTTHKKRPLSISPDGPNKVVKI